MIFQILQFLFGTKVITKEDIRVELWLSTHKVAMISRIEIATNDNTFDFHNFPPQLRVNSIGNRKHLLWLSTCLRER